MASLCSSSRFLLTRMKTVISSETTKKAILRRAHHDTSLEQYDDYTTIRVSSPAEHVLQVELNRPEKRNAFNRMLWSEWKSCFERIASDFTCRAVVVSGAGKTFTAGLDLIDAGELLNVPGEDNARKALWLRELIIRFQDTFSNIEKCSQPVIAAVHSGCVGAGVDLITACDIRYAAKDSFYSVKEVDIGLAADVGSLQRLPKVMGNQSLVRELCYTGRRMYADEALSGGLVSRIFDDRQATIDGAVALASEIANKSTVAVAGTKMNLLYSRDHAVAESLDFVANWNMSMLQTEDIHNAVQATYSKTKPTFNDLAKTNVKRL